MSTTMHEALPVTSHLLSPVLRWAQSEPQRELAGARHGDRVAWLTAADIHERVRALAKGLIASGVAPGDRVTLMSRTRLEWPLVDYAIMLAGAVTVPIYDTSSSEQVRWILEDSGSVLGVVETAAQRTGHEEARLSAPAFREALVIDEGGLDELARRGVDVSDEAVAERLAALGPTSPATILYTSGTTGRPKGCRLTQGNLSANVTQGLEAARDMLGPDETNLLFLPMAHALARIIWLIGFEHGVRTVFAPDMTQLPDELAVARPTMVVAVPRVFEKVYQRARHKATVEGHARLFDRAAEVATAWGQARFGKPVRLLGRVQHAVFERLVYRRIRAGFGGRLKLAVSGGGPLGERLTHFFAGVGIDIYEGYGLTESSPVLTLNRPGAWKVGTVGQPVPGTELRIEADGEILARGPQIFAGYWRAPEATAATLTPDGWLRTGDVGAVDSDGFLRITGRKKDLIVTAAGKNVAPAPLEDRLRAHPLVSEAVVLGDRRPYVIALVALDPEGLADWAAEHPGVGAGDDLSAHPDVLAEVQQAVDAANASVSRAESIRRFAILPEDLTIADGELTPTLKVRRAVIEERYADLVAGLYA
jgi:long-chain acyl-CoA synthetase